LCGVIRYALLNSVVDIRKIAVLFPGERQAHSCQFRKYTIENILITVSYNHL